MSSSSRRQRQECDNDYISNTQQQRQANNGYWRNELDLLGIEPKQKKKELDDNREELENLAGIIKQEVMFQDYELAYSEEGDVHKEETQSTAVGGLFAYHA